MKYLKYICVFAFFLILSCGKDEEENLPCQTLVEEHLIFGTYYGECLGNCANFYKIEACQVFEDDMLSYYTSDLKFMSDPMSLEDYEVAIDASNMFPEELWNELDSVFGIPDAYDQGGIFIQKNQNGEIKSWNLDTNEEVLPEYLAEYASTIKSIIQKLQE